MSIICLCLAIYACEPTTGSVGELEDYIPENSKVLLKIGNFETFKNDLKNSSLVSALDGSKIFGELSGNQTMLSRIKSSDKSIISLQVMQDSSIGFAWMSKFDPNVMNFDSIADINSEELNFKKQKILKLSFETNTNFTTVLDSIFILSSHRQTLENIINGNTAQDPTIQKLYGLKKQYETTLITQADDAGVSIDLIVNPSSLSETGVWLPKDSVAQVLNTFKGIIPQRITLPTIIPASASNATVFTYNDFELFDTQLRELRMDSTEIAGTTFLGSVSEVGLIELKEESIFALRSIDPDLTQESLGPLISQKTEFREVIIYDVSETGLFAEVFEPIAKKDSVKFMAKVEDYFIFSNSEAKLQTVISAFKSNATLAKSSYFEQGSLALSDAGSLMYYRLGNNKSKGISKILPDIISEGMEGINLKKYPFVAVQLTYDRNFAHINLIATESSNASDVSQIVSEEFNIQLENAVLGNPQFFTNHRTKGKDVIVQDINNTFYFISPKGKILWKKQLKAPILGKVQEVDLLRNGRKQLAFTTKNTFYVLDRNGKEVKPFPLKFKDEVTQPLSVFDYDNNRKYRFLITQGSEVLMYDNKAKIVSGFTFKKADTDLVMSPQHIRMNNKDYLLLAEESGKINILSRVGKDRIKVSDKFEFSNIPIAREGSNFVIITKDNKKITISQSGKISKLDLNVSSSYDFQVRGTTKVTLDDNLLRVNGKLVELPLGIYTKPVVSTVNRKTYIAITETQEKKLFLYDRSGGLIDGFPIYGSSIPDIGDATRNRKPNLVVNGGEKEVILYSLQ